jgi:D-methionine transport system substrate-binding protein
MGRPFLTLQRIELMKRRYFVQLLAIGTLAAGFTSIASAQQSQIIKVGVTPGPHAQILESVKPRSR